MPHTSCSNSADGQLTWSHGSGGLQHRQQVLHEVRQVGHDLLTCARPSHYCHAHREHVTGTRTSMPCQDSSWNIIIIMYLYYALISVLNPHRAQSCQNNLGEILYGNTHMHACKHAHPPKLTVLGVRVWALTEILNKHFQGVVALGQPTGIFVSLLCCLSQVLKQKRQQLGCILCYIRLKKKYRAIKT